MKLKTTPLVIAFEGIDGSGKTTQAASLAKWLTETCGLSVVQIREPGGSIGPEVRRLVNDYSLPSLTKVLLFMAARATLFNEQEEAIRHCDVVITDRSVLSTHAYQDTARHGLDTWVNHTSRMVAKELSEPHLTLLLDLPVSIALSRISNPDKIESQGVDYFECVRYRYLKAAETSTQGIVVVPAWAPVDSIGFIVQNHVMALLRRHMIEPGPITPTDRSLASGS